MTISFIAHDPGTQPNVLGRICTYVDSLSCFTDTEKYEPSEKQVVLKLEYIRHILVCAYGYKLQDGRLTRGAASAGARYPTDILVELNIGQENLILLYHFEENAFFKLENNGQYNSKMHLKQTNQIVRIYAVSILWRSVQRYGMRALQYCIVDGAIVLSNILEICNDLSVDCCILSPLSSNKIIGKSLPSMVCAIGAVELDLATGKSFKHLTAEFKSFLNEEDIGFTFAREESPTFSPVLKRTEINHDWALTKGRDYSLTYLSPSISKRKPLHWVFLRKSMKNTKIDSLSKTIIKQIAYKCAVLCKLFSIPGYIDLKFWFVFRDKFNDCKILSYPNMKVKNAEELSTDSNYNSLSSLAFENQSIVSSSSAIVVFGYEKENLQDLADHELDVCFQIGLLISELYRLQTIERFDGTAIGGFSPNNITSFSNRPNFKPVMAYCFGKQSTPGKKYDAVPSTYFTSNSKSRR